MGVGSLMTLATRSMTANTATLNVIGNNIANANTPGYSRQTVVLETAGGQFSGTGYSPKGVQVATVIRSSDAFLTRELNVATAQAASDSARAGQLVQLENLFPSGEQGVGYAVGELVNGFVDVTSLPQDLSARQVVLARAQEVVLRMRNAADGLDQLQEGVAIDLRNTVKSVNILAERVGELNARITEAQGNGHTPNDLLDQREEMIRQINQYIQVTTVPSPDGSLGVFIGGGQRLVLGGQASPLRVIPDTFDLSQVRLAVEIAGQNVPLETNLLGGGSVSGMLRFQDEDLASARAGLGQLATTMATTMNAQQALGLDLNGMPGTDLFNIADPTVLPAAGNSGTGSLSVTVSDSLYLQATDYEVRVVNDAPQTWEVRRLSDDRVMTLAAGDSWDGFTINTAATAPSIGDRFLIRPTSDATRSLSMALDDPKGLAAASPLQASLGAGNAGTTTIASLRMTAPVTPPAPTVNVVFTSAAGAYEVRDALGNALAAGTWDGSAPIAFGDFELTLQGRPSLNDSVVVGATQFPAGNNGNALAFSQLGQRETTGRLVLANGSEVAGTTFQTAYAQVMADIGVRVQGAKAAAEVTTSVLQDAKQALSAKTGVNLDEEAARLIQFQQSYQAAAKALQVAQSVFDTLLQAAGR